MSEYHFPLYFKGCDISSFKINENVFIRKITQREKNEYFGIDDIDFVDKGAWMHILVGKYTPSKMEGREKYKNLVKKGLFDGTDDILVSNYICLFKEGEKTYHTSHDLSDVDKINLTFAIFKPSSTGLWIGFSKSDSSTYYNPKVMLHGPFDYLSLQRKDLSKIRKINTLINERNDDQKFHFFSNLYLKSVGGKELDIDLRFLLLSMILEGLYNSGSQNELSFRISIKAARILSRGGYGKEKDIFKLVKKLYGIRSSLIHGRKMKKADYQYFYSFVDVIRFSLKLYMQDESDFVEDKIQNIIYR